MALYFTCNFCLKINTNNNGLKTSSCVNYQEEKNLSSCCECNFSWVKSKNKKAKRLTNAWILSRDLKKAGEHQVGSNTNCKFGLVWFYNISTIVGYLIPNILYTYILNIYDFFRFGFWHINHCRLFNTKYSLYIYIKYMIFLGLVFDISTIVGYLIPNILYTYIWFLLIWFLTYQQLLVI